MQLKDYISEAVSHGRGKYANADEINWDNSVDEFTRILDDLGFVETDSRSDVVSGRIKTYWKSGMNTDGTIDIFINNKNKKFMCRVMFTTFVKKEGKMSQIIRMSLGGMFTFPKDMIIDDLIEYVERGYVKEAVSHGRRRSYGLEGKVNINTTMSELFYALEKCGINWRPIKSSNIVPDRNYIVKAIEEWSYNYNAFVLKNGITVVLVVPDKGRLFKLVWPTEYADNEGPSEVVYYKEKQLHAGSVVSTETDDIRKAIDELNHCLAEAEGLF